MQTRDASANLLVFSLKNDAGYLHGATLRDESLAAIPPETVFLNLEGADVSDAGIAQLPKLPRLRGIDLDSTGVSDPAMNRLSEFENLEEVWVEDTRVTDAGVLALGRLRHLRFLSVAHCRVSDSAITALRQRFPEIEVGQ